ncbi:MAG: hypothetical protein ACLUE2_06345 [Bacteroides cellulosilyticus]
MNPAIPEDILSESLPVAVSEDKPVMLIVDDNEEMLNFLPAISLINTLFLRLKMG